MTVTVQLSWIFWTTAITILSKHSATENKNHYLLDYTSWLFWYTLAPFHRNWYGGVVVGVSFAVTVGCGVCSMYQCAVWKWVLILISSVLLGWWGVLILILYHRAGQPKLTLFWGGFSVKINTGWTDGRKLTKKLREKCLDRTGLSLKQNEKLHWWE